MDQTELARDVGTAAAKMSPPVITAAVGIAGWGPSEWMYASMALYGFLQAAYLAWKWLREWRAGKAPA